MDTELSDLEVKISKIDVADLIRSKDPSLGIADVESEVTDAILWIKRFFKNTKYIEQLPVLKKDTYKNAVRDFVARIEDIESVRVSDPTSFIRSKETYINDLRRATSLVYEQITEPLRTYIVHNRGRDYIERANDALQDIEFSKTLANTAASAQQEAAADTAVDTSAEFYDLLADDFSKRARNWLIVFWVYTASLLLSLYVAASRSNEVKTILIGFDTREGLVFKLALLLLVGYAYGFIARNYQSAMSVLVAAKTRVVILKTWRAFLAAEEFNGPDNTARRASISEHVARQVFDRIHTSPDKKNGKLIDNPVNVFTNARNGIDDIVNR